MPNASILEWFWTGAMLGALLFSSLYMARLVVRGMWIWRRKENGPVRSFWVWQFVVTLFFVLSAAMFSAIGYLSMLALAPGAREVTALQEATATAFIVYAFAKMGVQWFIWFMDRNTVERAVEAAAKEEAASAIAIVEANTEAVQENTAAVEANTEQKSGD